MKNFYVYLLALFSLRVAAQDLQATENETVLKVNVVNVKKKPQEGEVVTFVSLKDSKSFTGTTNAEGQFSILIPNGQKYKVQYKAFSKEKDYTTLEIPKVENLTFDYTIIVQPPRVFTLDNVFFDTGKSTLRNESFKELNELAEYMALKKDLKIEIAGHTDNVGTAADNQKLSEERAAAVKQYLEKKGIAPGRVTAKGYGDTQPIATNTTPEGKQKNRRTEVRIISE